MKRLLPVLCVFVLPILTACPITGVQNYGPSVQWDFVPKSLDRSSGKPDFMVCRDSIQATIPRWDKEERSEDIAEAKRRGFTEKQCAGITGRFTEAQITAGRKIPRTIQPRGSWGSPGAYLNPNHVERLIETKRCPRCDLAGSQLDGANLEKANLIYAKLWDANLQGANLQGANLQGANLSGANLVGASLERANLRDANFYGANLQGANLSGANLVHANLDPEGIKIAIASGAVNVPEPVVVVKLTPKVTLKKNLKPPVVAKVAPKKTKPKSPAQSVIASGFFVSRFSHVITNEHVVRGCKSVTIGDNARKQSPANVEETDRRNDLALLKLTSLTMASAETKSLIARLGIRVVPLASDGLLRSEDVELGEKIMVAGYPYGDVFSNAVKVTRGIVSATRGLGDDSGQFQLDAAVQKGSSGGPIYDENGNVVGVVVAKLDRAKMAKRIGSMPENMNFGIKASTVSQFLNASGLPTKRSKRSKSISTRELAKIAKSQTVMVVCHQ